MAHDPEPFRVGSHHLITGVVRDNGVPLSLAGATLALKLKIVPYDGSAPGAVKSFNATPDADQVTNTGKYSYQCGSTDLDVAGTGYLQVFVTTGGSTHKSIVIDRQVQESLV